MGIDNDTREVIQLVIMILAAAIFAAPFVITMIAKLKLKSHFLKRMKTPGVTPKMVREEIKSLGKKNWPWYMKWLCYLKHGRADEYKMKEFLKSYCGVHFNRSYTYELDLAE